tara:strand:- start:923 stop:1339 length:417 start_codon:yes stop_codon:yes gene_type:complete
MPIIGGTEVNKQIDQKYAYFIRGRQLIIVQFKDEVSKANSRVNEPHYTAPKENITNGLMLEYTAIPDTSELLQSSDVIPVHDTLALALVDYCKAQLLDRPEDLRQRELHMQRFRDRIAKYTEARIGGLKRVLGNNFLR